MTMTFDTFGNLTSQMAFDVIDALADEGVTASFGKSNQSPSAYVNVSVCDEDGDEIDTFKVRFSDHADRYGSDVTFRIDDMIETIEDDGEYIATTMEDWRYADAIETAVAKVRAFLASVEA